jgi:hypothetical protein
VPKIPCTTVSEPVINNSQMCRGCKNGARVYSSNEVIEVFGYRKQIPVVILSYSHVAVTENRMSRHLLVLIVFLYSLQDYII